MVLAFFFAGLGRFQGIVVVQTSADPEVVAALHLHAAGVSHMVARGMHAVHEMMMTRASN